MPIQSLRKINEFSTLNEIEILDYKNFQQKKEQIVKLQKLGLYPFQQSELFKQLMQDYDWQRPEHYHLIEASKTHIQEHSNPELKNNIIVLVHPFYLYIHQNSRIPEINNILTMEHLKDSELYIQNIQRVLCGNEFKDYSVIFFEELDAYYQFSSYFLERGKIDRTILTTNNDGIVLSVRDKNAKFKHSKKALEALKGKNLFFGGGYAGFYDQKLEKRNQCLDNAILDINKQYYPKEQRPKMFLIEDLIINSPIIGRSLFEHVRTGFYHDKYSTNQVVRLDEL